MIKNRNAEEVDPDPQTDAPDLSDEAIARIRDSNRHLVEDYHPTSSLFPGEAILIDEEKHLGILAGLADGDAGRIIPHAEVKSRVKAFIRAIPRPIRTPHTQALRNSSSSP